MLKAVEGFSKGDALILLLINDGPIRADTNTRLEVRPHFCTRFVRIIPDTIPLRGPAKAVQIHSR